MLIASFASWHERHDEARRVVPGSALITHVASETYSVLTRLPAPHRVEPELVARLLVAQFPDPWQVLPAESHAELLGRLPELGITGGAVYDAVIGATAKAGGGTLVSFDRRAARTYERLGVEVSLLAD